MSDLNADIRVTKLDDGVLATAGFSTEEIARLIILNRNHSEVQVVSALKALHPLMWAEITANPKIIEWEREASARGWAPRPSDFQSLYGILYELGEPRGFLDEDYLEVEFPQARDPRAYRVVANAGCIDGPYGYNTFWDVNPDDMQRLLKLQKRIWDSEMEQFEKSQDEFDVSRQIRKPRIVSVALPEPQYSTVEVSSTEGSAPVSPSGFSRGFSPFGSPVGGFAPEGETEPYTPEQVQQIAGAFNHLAEFSNEYRLSSYSLHSAGRRAALRIEWSCDREDDFEQHNRNRQVAEAILGVLKLAIPAYEGAEHVEEN